jgi:hypothetical protein
LLGSAAHRGGAGAALRRFVHGPSFQETSVTITIAHLAPIVALIAGVLILLMPRLLNFIVAIYLIVTGLLGLGIFK